MTKSSSDSVLDASLDKSATATTLHICAGAPADRAAAIANSLADQALVPGDFAKANGDTSGRKLRYLAKSGINVDTSGTADHLAYIDATELLNVTECTPQALTAGNTVDVPEFDQEIADPT